MSEFHNDFTEIIRSRRKAMGLSQRQLAERIGVKQMAISRYERGMFPKDNAIIDRLADALGITLAATTENGAIDEVLHAAGFEVRWVKGTLLAEKDGKCWACVPYEPKGKE